MLFAVPRQIRGVRRLLAAVLLALVALALAPVAPARAAGPFVVNTTADTHDALPGNGLCADATGMCSLRAAVEESNALAGMDQVVLGAGTFVIEEPLVVDDFVRLNGAGKTATFIDGNQSTELLYIRSQELLVCDAADSSVASYRPNGGAKPDFLPAGAGGMDTPTAIDVGFGGDVYVAAFASGVHRFSSAGVYEGMLMDPASPGMEGFAPSDAVVGDAEDLEYHVFVADYYPNNRVLRVDQAGGAAQLLLPDGEGGMQQPSSLAFYKEYLYVSSTGTNQVLRYDGPTGTFDTALVPGGLDHPRDLAFRGDTLYVADQGSDRVLMFDADSGAPRGELVAAGAGGLDGPTDLTFGPDGDLYVVSGGTQQVLRYDGETGAFRGVFVAGGNASLGNPSCVMWRSGASGGPSAIISDLTLRNGATQQTGGPTAGIHIESGAGAALYGVAVSGNNSSEFGGGIQNWGLLSMIESEVRNNTLPEGGGGQTSQGGGIFNTGELLIERSLIAGNTATRGGGISNTNQGEVRIVNSTISGNRVLGSGGGIRNVADGVVEISASTITDNYANEPGMLLFAEPDRLGGGIYTSETAKTIMSNTIVASNIDNRTRYDAEFSPDCYSPEPGRMVSNRDNLVGILTDNCVLQDAESGDTSYEVFGTPLVPLDPRLHPLSMNGGATATHALMSDSPAVNADAHQIVGDGFYNCKPVDQRGTARPQGRRCDIGAFELIQGLVQLPPPGDLKPIPPIVPGTGPVLRSTAP